MTEEYADWLGMEIRLLLERIQGSDWENQAMHWTPEEDEVEH